MRRFDLRGRTAPPGAPTVAANLLRPAAAGLGGAAGAAGRAGPGALIASGLLVAEADGVVRRSGRPGCARRERLESGEWAALLLVR